MKLKMRKEDVALTTGNQVTSNYVLALLWAFAVSSPRQLEIKHKKQKKNVSIPLSPQQIDKKKRTPKFNTRYAII